MMCKTWKCGLTASLLSASGSILSMLQKLWYAWYVLSIQYLKKHGHDMYRIKLNKLRASLESYRTYYRLAAKKMVQDV